MAKIDKEGRNLSSINLGKISRDIIIIMCTKNRNVKA
jgi:hypothetical protein